jgi:hypothetical protein
MTASDRRLPEASPDGTLECLGRLSDRSSSVLTFQGPLFNRAVGFDLQDYLGRTRTPKRGTGSTERVVNLSPTRVAEALGRMISKSLRLKLIGRERWSWTDRFFCT